jgi:hypothetical protein
LPPSKGDTEDRLLDIDRVISAHLEAVCCDGGKNVLYVGIEELGAPRHEIRPAPGGDVTLPETIVAEYNAAQDAERKKTTRASKFPTLLTGETLEITRQVLRESGEEYQRAIAALALPHAWRKADVVSDLHNALTDNDSTVRANALRGLMALEQAGRADPASKLRVAPEWFVPLLQSIGWSDRTLAVTALGEYTRNRDVVLLAKLGTSELDALIEMSHWRTEQYAYPAFLLIGRVAGMTDLTIRDSWLRGGRDTTIAKARAARR